MKRYAIASLIFAGLALSGCKPSDLADANVLQQARIYFPLAEIVHRQNDELRVRTHVNNISEPFAAKVFASFLTEHRSDLDLLGFLGYRAIAVEFETNECFWVNTWPIFRCLSFAAPRDPHAYAFDGTPAEIVQ